MRLLRYASLLALCIAPALAIHEAEVGVVDWHKKLIGVPLTDAVATAPVFHRVGDTATQSVVLTASANNVLAAIHPVNGSVAWRHIFDPKDHITSFYKHGTVVAALSGTGGATLRLFEALTGHLLLEKRLHRPETAHLTEPGHIGTSVAFAPSVDSALFVLTNSHVVRHITDTGDVKWTWTSPDQTSLVVYSNLVVTPDTIYAVGLAKSLASYTLHITALAAATGEELASANIPSSIANGLTDFTTLSRTSDAAVTPRVVWLEQGAVKSIALTPALKGKVATIKGTAYKQIIDVGVSGHGQLVAVKEDGKSRVLKLDTDGSGVKSIWEFESAPSNAHTESIFAGGFDSAGYPYIARVYWSHSLAKAAVEIFSSHLADGKGMITGYSFPFDTSTHGIINHVAIDAANPSGWTVLTRLVVTTNTGAVQLWQQDKVQWTREEALASITVTEFVELPERQIASFNVGREAETFLQRIQRQLQDAQNFPQYLVHFVKRFATGSYASVSASAADETGLLSRDAFGFRQVIVAATPYGKVFGIDSSNGNILWSRVFGLGWAASVGGHILPVKLFVTRTVADVASPQVVLVTQRKADNSLVDTVIFHLDALTGDDVRTASNKNDLLQGFDIISGPLVESYLLNLEAGKVVVLLDEFLQVHLYPDTPENAAAFAKVAPSLHFPLRTSTAGKRRIQGHQVARNPNLSDKPVAYPTWALALPAEEDVQDLLPAARGPVASIGKVLGNRTTLYKYLNPRLFVVLTSSHAVTPPTCGVYLVDSTKGSIVYRVTLPANGGACDVKAALTENWLIYHYYDNEFTPTGQTKGYRMVSVELYEGKKPDDKIKSSDLSSYSHESTEITAIEQSYIFPHAITAISTTSTKFGITGKDIIVATANHKIQSFPRRLLDPRRPARKVTAEEAEEFLIQYEAQLPDDPRRVLSHHYEVARTRRIVTAPALLESTSLVLAHGLDLFLTRVAPSGTFDVLSENFNKAQLVFTVLGLAAAIVVTKPMVQRKRLRERWYQ